MRTFKDNTDRMWVVSINVAAIKRVRGLVDVDLLEVVEGKLIDRLVHDPILLCDIVYALCKPEADALGVSDEEFGKAMAGDAIEHATTALLEELVSFCPSPRDRRHLGRVLQITRNVMEKARDEIDARIEAGELERMAEEALKRAISSSGIAPASSALTPAT